MNENKVMSYPKWRQVTYEHEHTPLKNEDELITLYAQYYAKSTQHAEGMRVGESITPVSTDVEQMAKSMYIQGALDMLLEPDDSDNTPEMLWDTYRTNNTAIQSQSVQPTCSVREDADRYAFNTQLNSVNTEIRDAYEAGAARNLPVSNGWAEMIKFVEYIQWVQDTYLNGWKFQVSPEDMYKAYKLTHSPAGNTTGK
jgi:hypothetical protein